MIKKIIINYSDIMQRMGTAEFQLTTHYLESGHQIKGALRKGANYLKIALNFLMQLDLYGTQENMNGEICIFYFKIT